MSDAQSRLKVDFPTSRASNSGGGPTSIVFFLLTTVIAFLLPAALNLFFPVVAVGLALQLLSSGLRVAFWEFCLWLYLLTPLLRRVVDWRSQFHLNSPILVSAPLVALLGLLALKDHQWLRVAPALALAGAFVSITYASAVGLFYGPVLPVAIALLQWLSPLALALVVLNTPSERLDFLAALTRLSRWGLLLLGGYGVVQFLILPPWDAAWMRNVSDVLTSIGPPQAGLVRVFSASNAPGSLAEVLVVLLLLNLAARHSWLDDIALILGLVALGLSQVRSAWLVLGAAVIFLALTRRFPLGRSLLLVLSISTLALISGGPISNIVSQRVESTTTAGTQDVSLQARLQFQSSMLPSVLKDPLGEGLGSTGTAVQRSGSAEADAFENTDSGYLEILRDLGAVPGIAFLIVVLFTAMSTWKQALRSNGVFSGLVVALSASVVVLPLELLFGPSVTGLNGIFFWTVIAMVANPTQSGHKAAR